MIDIKNVNIQRLKLTDLIEDAVDRNNKEALEWLRTEAKKKVDRKQKDGSVTQVYQPANMFRIEYLTRFCGYEKKVAVKLTPEQKKERRLDGMFDKAFALLEEG